MFKMAAKENVFDVRADFPILESGVAYLDTAASAQKPRAVIDAMNSFVETNYANIHRGLYKFSQESTAAYEAAREKVAGFIGAPSGEEIVFTRNATEGFNLIAQSWGTTFLKEGDEIILSEMEHHANIVPWQLLRDKIGFTIKVIPVLENGTLDLEAYKALLTEKTKLISLVHISNSLGTVNPVQAVIQTAKAFNPDIVTVIDGSQSAVHGPVNVAELNCDFFVCTGHKLYGPTGVGVLWGRGELLDAMPPYQGGGDMIEEVTFERTSYKAAPARFEAGTPAIIEAIGLGAAIDYLQGIGMDHVAAHEKNLLDEAMTKLSSFDGLRFYGTAQEKAGIISFTADWAHTSDISMILDQCNVYVRSGHHCCMPLMQRLGIDGTVRASFGLYSNSEDIDALVGGLEKAKRMLG